jgi:hypothetical protein
VGNVHVVYWNLSIFLLAILLTITKLGNEDLRFIYRCRGKNVCDFFVSKQFTFFTGKANLIPIKNYFYSPKI